MNKEKGTMSNREMIQAYLDLNNGVFKVDKVDDVKFHVTDQTVAYDKCGFDLEIKSGHSPPHVRSHAGRKRRVTFGRA